MGTKRCDCSCSSLSYNNSTHGSNCFNNAQRKPQQEKVSVHPSTDKMNSAIFSTNATITAKNISNNSANALISDISSTSSTENSFVTSSPSAKQKCTNPPVTVETSQIKNNDSESKLVSTINGSISCADSSLNRAGDCKTSSRSSATGHPSPNSYSLDFLHSVGVQMTGGVKLDGVNTVANNMRPIIAGMYYNFMCTRK